MSGGGNGYQVQQQGSIDPVSLAALMQVQLAMAGMNAAQVEVSSPAIRGWLSTLWAWLKGVP